MPDEEQPPQNITVNVDMSETNGLLSQLNSLQTDSNLLLEQIHDLNFWLFAVGFVLIGMIGILIFFVAKGEN